MKKLIESVRYRLRWSLVSSYALLLTCELLTSNPWTVLFPKFISDHPPLDTSSDTSSFFLHTGSYLVFGLLIQWALAKKQPSHIRSGLGLAILHGGICEILQQWVPERWPSFEDALCNTLGITLSYLLVHAITSLKLPRTRQIKILN